MKISINEIKNKFLTFFYNKGHKIIKGSSLIPKNDQTLLFTNSGMNQFKNIFLGINKYSYKRVATSQYCIRAGGKHNDFKNIGYTTRHHTFFEMLGNFSFGDYFKYDAIKFAWELLTSRNWFNIPTEKLWVTVYYKDSVTYDIWANKIGIPKKKIIRIGDKNNNINSSDNFWQMGNTGPCGPSSEIFYDYGDHILDSLPGDIKHNGNRYIEIWNLVFMQFNRQIDGKLLPLPNPSVDTGMGLERITTVLQKVTSNYDIDIFKNLIIKIAEIIKTNNINNKSLRVIADHIRASSFLINEDIIPSNNGRGFVLRKIIRRAIQYGNILGIKNNFFYKLVSPLINIMNNDENKINLKKKFIKQVIYKEEKQFNYTIKRGISILNYKLKKLNNKKLDIKTIFILYDTYGLPLKLTLKICKKKNIYVDIKNLKKFLNIKNKKINIYKKKEINQNISFYLNKKPLFIGYKNYKHIGYIIALFNKKGEKKKIINKGDKAIIILDKTPFYPEINSKISDKGEIKSKSATFKVNKTKKYNKTICHIGIINNGKLKINMQIISIINKKTKYK